VDDRYFDDSFTGHMNFGQRYYPWSCYCRYYKMLDLCSAPMTCLSMQSNSTYVWLCLRMVWAV